MSSERGQALFSAIDGGDLGAVRTIIAAEPALAGARDAAGVSAILYARYRGRAEIADALLAAAPGIDIFDASAAGRVGEVARCLDASPKDAKAFSADGFTALHLAAFFNRPDVVALLIARGAGVDAVSRNAMRVRALHSAATMRAATVVKSLLASGADPNATQKRGITALMSAAASGDTESVMALLAHGADVSARSTDGKSALDHARERNREDVVDLLLEGAARR